MPLTVNFRSVTRSRLACSPPAFVANVRNTSWRYMPIYSKYRDSVGVAPLSQRRFFIEWAVRKAAS